MFTDWQMKVSRTHIKGREIHRPLKCHDITFDLRQLNLNRFGKRVHGPHIGRPPQDGRCIMDWLKGQIHQK